jgi:hypothetical protein
MIQKVKTFFQNQLQLKQPSDATKTNGAADE